LASAEFLGVYNKLFCLRGHLVRNTAGGDTICNSCWWSYETSPSRPLQSQYLA